MNKYSIPNYKSMVLAALLAALACSGLCATTQTDPPASEASPATGQSTQESANATSNSDSSTPSSQSQAQAADSGNPGVIGSVTPASTPDSTKLNFQPDLFTGRFGYSVPIVVAPGRQGAQPTLTLAY